MSQKTSSQSQQIPSMVEGWLAEFEKAEKRQIEFANEAIDEASKLMKAQMNYSLKLAADFRSLTLAFMNAGRPS